MKAALALAHLAAGRQQGIGEGLDLLAGLAQQMQRQPLGRARTNARQPLELIDQPGQGAGETAQDARRNWPESRGLFGGGVRAAAWGGRMPAAPPLPLMELPMGSPAPSRLRRLLPLLLAGVLALAVSACSAAAAGLNSFQSPDGRYAFLYPTGWTRVQVSEGPQVVFHDLINADETLSLVVSEVNSTNTLENLGSAVAVGEKLRRIVIAPEGSGREAELVEAEEREDGGRTFYDLEYAVHLNDRDRHELATVVVDRGRLYTFAASTNELRWPKVKGLFHQVISSFTLRI
jgi:photosystem II oxygen-evolving enhancer protein 2